MSFSSPTPPVSFPGISSGIDYNSIIQKLTSLTTAPEAGLNAQISTLNAANLELIKINGLLSSVQTALTGISQPSLFSTYSAISNNTSVATAQGIPSVVATPGTYVIQSAQLGTATSITSSLSVGHSELDNINAAPVPADTVKLSDSYAAVTPTNGASGNGSVTIDGVQVSYDVGSQSLNTILANIQTAVQVVDPGFTASLQAGTDTVEFKSTDKPISIGSAGDKGNILTVFRLDTAQILNSTSSGDIVGTAGVGGINQAATLNSTNSTGYATNANYKTAVTAGVFTINGVAINVDPTKDNLAGVLARINSSSAGVIAAYNQATGQITLTNKTAGPSNIVLGAGTDTSNFLSASGLTSASGATTAVGTQAHLVLQTPGGGTQNIYSNSNTITNAIPGVQINLTASSATPFTITVAQDTSQLVSALNTFVSAYNTAITEINTATRAPIVTPLPVGSLPGSSNNQLPGGVLYNNSDIIGVKDELTRLISSLQPGNDRNYNSLGSLGLALDSSFSQIVASGNGSVGGSNSNNNQSISTKTFDGTDGALAPLDTAKLATALAADPLQVQNIFTSSSGLIGQLGSYLTGVTGLPTTLGTGLVGSIPPTPVIQGFENANTSEIQSIQQQIQQITDNANQQAASLRQQFTGTETQIAGYQALQQQLAGFLKNG